MEKVVLICNNCLEEIDYKKNPERTMWHEFITVGYMTMEDYRHMKKNAELNAWNHLCNNCFELLKVRKKNYQIE